MCASVERILDNDNNNTIGLFSAFHGPQKRFREQTCKVVVVENHVTHRLSPSFHSTLAKMPSSPIAPAEKTFWHRHCVQATTLTKFALFTSSVPCAVFSYQNMDRVGRISPSDCQMKGMNSGLVHVLRTQKSQLISQIQINAIRKQTQVLNKGTFHVGGFS